MASHTPQTSASSFRLCGGLLVVEFHACVTKGKKKHSPSLVCDVAGATKKLFEF